MANTHGTCEGVTPKLASAGNDADPEIVALGRYLGMDGKMGYVPEWYYLIRAADRLHCTPWELLEQSIYWQDIAVKAISAENRGVDIKAQRNKHT